MSEPRDDQANVAEDDVDRSRRSVLAAAAATTVAAAIGGVRTVHAATPDPYAEPDNPALPPSDMVLQLDKTALVVIDPQIDFLSPNGVTWPVVGESVTQNNTVENLERLFRAAKQSGIVTAVSPHYYYPTDKGWRFEGGIEKLMHKIGMFNREGPYTLDGFEGSGADFMEQFKSYILDGKTIVVSPHNRKNNVSQVLLAGMSANLCVESHLRELLEQGFEVAVVKDATAAARLPEGDGYAAALTNFRYVANALWTTDEAVRNLLG
jgi:nicotinamidase-related amidase